MIRVAAVGDLHVGEDSRGTLLRIAGGYDRLASQVETRTDSTG